jgi:selenophosphate synthetase-related protein
MTAQIPVDTPVASPTELAALAHQIREFPGLTSKSAIGVVSDILGASDWLGGPGDDGAAAPFGDAHVIACGEALWPPFVRQDPYGSGIAAVLTNINDLAAMGAYPIGIVDTVVADDETAREVLLGLRHGCEIYDVTILGGHLTRYAGEPSVSAFGVGRANKPLSVTRVEPGQLLILACCTEGDMRTDFPFFRSFEQRAGRTAGDVRVLAELADSGACAAAKDVSMAGLVGSLAMLLEHGRFGVTLELDGLPRPADVALARWLMCFPSFAFLLTSPPDRVDECRQAFLDRGLEAVVVGEINSSGSVQLSSGGHQVEVFDLTKQAVTGLR